MKFQIVEKDDYGTDWHTVMYEAVAMGRFDTQEDALKAATGYLTQRNCNNPLTKDEKKNASEVFMMMKDASGEATGCFMGVLDQEDWYLTDRHGKPVTDPRYFELEGKTQVAVRPVRGT